MGHHKGLKNSSNQITKDQIKSEDHKLKIDWLDFINQEPKILGLTLEP